MNITDELRRWAEDRAFVMGESGFARRIAEFCDRIDAEHEDQLLGERSIAYNAGYDSGFASADDWLAQHEDAMAEHGWVRLPVDADGVPIRIGDGVTHKSLVKPVVVVGVGKDDFFYQKGAGFRWFFHAHEVHHYHAPTVEDVLREFAERYLDYEGVPSAGRRGIGEALMDEYAAKLRLAGDAE